MRRARFLRAPIQVAHQYDVVVVGGGSTGCAVAANLASGNARTLVVEAGPSTLASSVPQWHTQMPAAKWVHRASKRYVEAHPAQGGSSIAVGDETVAPPVALESPRVLGGAGVVLGSKSYMRGHAEDYSDFPLSWADVMLPYYKKLECIEGLEVHRGQSGRMMVSKAKFVTQTHRPVLEALQKAGTPLIADFNHHRRMTRPGMGRSEALIDHFSSACLGGLATHLRMAQRLKRPVTVVGDTVVDSVTMDGNAATGVVLRNAAGETQTVAANSVVLAAGAVGTPQVLLRSGIPSSARDHVGTNLWAAPGLVLQYGLHQPISLADATSPVVQALVFAQWRYQGTGWAVSGFDDMCAFFSSTDGLYPDVRVDVQPFHTSPAGELLDRHGVQFHLQLMRPASRGRVTEDDVTPGLLSDPADAAALAAVAKIIGEAAAHLKPLHSDGRLLGSYTTATGPRGGTCALGTAVDPETMLLRDTANITVCDGSLIPRGVLADTVPMTLALAERCGDLMVRKAPPV